MKTIIYTCDTCGVTSENGEKDIKIFKTSFSFETNNICVSQSVELPHYNYNHSFSIGDVCPQCRKKFRRKAKAAFSSMLKKLKNEGIKATDQTVSNYDSDIPF